MIKLPPSVETTFGNEVSHRFACALVFSITERGQEVQTDEDIVEVVPRITEPVPALEALSLVQKPFLQVELSASFNGLANFWRTPSLWHFSEGAHRFPPV